MNELNYVLTRILDMDHRAAQVKKEAEKRMEKMELQTKETIQAMEKEIADAMEKRLSEYWQQVVRKAETESHEIREKAWKEAKAMKEAYEKNKDSLVQVAFQRMIAGS